MSNKILAIGERMHYKKYWLPIPEHRDSFDLRLRFPVFEPRRLLLDELGVIWDDSINLLWPSPVVGEWDKAEASRVVEVLYERVLLYPRVLLFGKRVCEVFKISFEVGQIFGQFIPLPHPSGLNRMWNDNEVREKVKRVMELSAFSSLSQRRGV